MKNITEERKNWISWHRFSKAIDLFIDTFYYTSLILTRYSDFLFFNYKILLSTLIATIVSMSGASIKHVLMESEKSFI